MSTRDWKLGEVVYLKSGSPAMTVVGTDSHGATKVQWYDPQAAEVERSMYPTATFPKDCLTEGCVPVRDAYQRYGAMESPRISAEQIQLVGVPAPSTEELRQLILETLNGWIRKREPVQAAQPSEKIVEATSRAAEQRSEQVTAQATAARTEPARNEQRQPPVDPAQASARHSRKNS